MDGDGATRGRSAAAAQGAQEGTRSSALDLETRGFNLSGALQVPSELDLTLELIGRLQPFELHLAVERDAPVARSGPDQVYAYALAVWAFDLVRRQPRPLETRGELRSP